MRLPIEIVSRRRRRANFDAYEIGQPVPGPLETLDSDEPWMGDHFTQENFEQLQDAQMDGELGPLLDMTRMAMQRREARFAEGDTAGFEKWLKSQPQKVQDDWAANKEKYGDKFKKKASDKQAKLMSRQEKILKDYLVSAGSRAVMDYDDLPSSVRDALTRVKDQETLWSDVNRWLMDNNKRNMRLAWDENDDDKPSGHTCECLSGKYRGEKIGLEAYPWDDSAERFAAKYFEVKPSEVNCKFMRATDNDPFIEPPYTRSGR